MEVLMVLVVISLLTMAATLSLFGVFLMKTFPKTKKKISTSRSPRTSQKADRVTEVVEEIISAAKTIADDPTLEQEELDDQAREKLEKVKRKREQEIEEAVLNSTQKTRDALDKTLQEIMTGVEVKEGKK
jgi:hypothetical protein